MGGCSSHQAAHSARSQISLVPNGPTQESASRKVVAIRRRIERHTVWSRSMWNHTFTYLLAALAGCCVLRGGESLRRCGVPRWRCALRPQYALVKTQLVSFAYYKHRLMCEGKMYRCTLGVYPPAERLVFSLSPSKTSSLGYYQCQGG